MISAQLVAYLCFIVFVLYFNLRITFHVSFITREAAWYTRFSAVYVYAYSFIHSSLFQATCIRVYVCM